MTATRKLYVNWLTKTLQFSDSNGGIVTLPNFTKYENIPFEIVIVEPDVSAVGAPKFTRVDISALSMSIALNDTYDDSTPIAYQNTFTKDEQLNTFTGSLSLNTAAMATFLGSSAFKEALFEIEIQEGTNLNKIYFATVIVRNAVATVGATVPSPVDEFYTKAQAVAQFLPRVGGAGDQQTYTSPGNVYQRVIGVDDNGQPIDQILAV